MWLYLQKTKLEWISEALARDKKEYLKTKQKRQVSYKIKAE